MSCQTICPFNNIINCLESKCKNECKLGKSTSSCINCTEKKCSEFAPGQNCVICGIFNNQNLDSNLCKDSTPKEVCEGVGLNCCKWVEDNNNKLSAGSIVGIIFGSLVTLGLLGVILYYSLRKSKHKR